MVARQLGDEKWRYHGIHIGAILEYLLRGVPFDIVKTIGRWSSEAFTLYLCRHVVAIAPYIQNSLIIEPFTRLVMPQYAETGVSHLQLPTWESSLCSTCRRAPNQMGIFTHQSFFQRDILSSKPCGFCPKHHRLNKATYFTPRHISNLDSRAMKHKDTMLVCTYIRYLRM